MTEHPQDTRYNGSTSSTNQQSTTQPRRTLPQPDTEVKCKYERRPDGEYAWQRTRAIIQAVTAPNGGDIR